MNIASLLSFSGVAMMMALSPGPNMIYLVSRSICQGPKASLISLMGVSLGFFFYMICSALGLSAVFLKAPILYVLLKLAGAFYLFYLAWNALKPGGRSPFQVSQLRYDPPLKLFQMGFLTNLFNPKIAMMYLSLIPQFIQPEGQSESYSVLTQFLILGGIQIFIGTTINGLIALSASSISKFLISNASLLLIQRWGFGCILLFLGVHLLFFSPLII